MPKIRNALEIIKRLGGDGSRCDHLTCPICGGHSLSVNNGDKQPVVVYCHKCGKEGGPAIIDKLKSMGVWPTSTKLDVTEAAFTAQQKRSAKERRNYAVRIWKDLLHSGGEDRASLLRKYLHGRGIKKVPSTALVTLPIVYEGSDFCSASPGMVLPVRDRDGKLQGIQVTWLSPDMKHKHSNEPQRQSYGLIKGNFVSLDKMDFENPPPTLLIGEGAETVLTAMQVTKLPGIATAGCSMMEGLEPPQCGEFIILADNGDAGQKSAKTLASGLQAQDACCVVRIASPARPEGGKDGYDWNDALMDGADRARMKEAIVGAPIFDADAEMSDDDAEDDPQRAKQVDVLLGLTSDADLFHNDDRGYADINVDGHRETWAVKSKGFRDWLLHRYYKKEKTAPTGEALRLAIETIGARARFDGSLREVFVRVGGHAGKIYLDLCDQEWRVVEIDADGWRVASNAPVRFTRAVGMSPLPVPVVGGSVAALRPFVNLAADKGQEDPAADTDFILLVAFLLALLRDRGPYPGLAVMGEEGTAKTTLVEVVRKLVDPSKVRERRLPREDRDLFIAARRSHVISYGNVSQIPDWLSDSLCSLSTGGGFGSRTLYTDEDETLFDGMRPVILNGIEFTTRSDLADRLVFLKLPQIRDRERRVEQEFWADFEQEQPGILGALLGVVAHGLRALPDTPFAVDYPRMADFAHWVTACEGALWESGTFKDAYANNRKRTNLDVIEGEAVATAVLRMMDARGEDWTGTASELLDQLETVVGEKEAKRKHWPGSASALSQRLRRVASRLRKLGIKTSFAREGGKRIRVITLKRAKPKPKSA